MNKVKKNFFNIADTKGLIRFKERGREKWNRSSSKEGNYEYGNKVWIGKYAWEDGTFYHGEWKNSKIHGLRCYKWVDTR